MSIQSLFLSLGPPINKLKEIALRSTLLLSVLICNFSYGNSFSPAVPMPSKHLDTELEVNRIALGSCYNQAETGEIFATIQRTKPDVFLFLGDNVYADDESDDPSLNSLKKAYSQLAQVSSFATLRQAVPVLTIWDDHDYGLDDAGGDWPRKQASESLYEYVWDIGGHDPRAQRDGVYFARSIGSKGRRVQIIFLDTRYFRTPLTRNTTDSFGIYLPSEDSEQNMLGNDQWRWLEQQLREPAELRIIISSVLVLSEIHGWESWRMMPRERQRFYELLKSTEAKGIIIVSGDTHAAGLYQSNTLLDYPLTEINSSSMNVPLTSFVKNPQQTPGIHRLGDIYFEENFGLIDIDWETGNITMQLRDKDNESVRKVNVNLVDLK